MSKIRNMDKWSHLRSAKPFNQPLSKSLLLSILTLVLLIMTAPAMATDGIDILSTALETPPTLYANLSNTISASIKNNGSGDASSFNVSLSADGSLVDKAGISGLDAGESTNVSFEWTPILAGKYNLTVIADCDDEIIESNETNNELKEEVVVITSNVRRLTFDSNSSVNPDVAADSDGNIHVVWSEDRGEWELYYKKIASNGTVLVNDKRICAGSEYIQFPPQPKIAVDSNGNVHVAFNNDTNFINVSYLKLDNIGNILVAPKQVISAVHTSSLGWRPTKAGGIVVDNGNVHIVGCSGCGKLPAVCKQEMTYVKLDNSGNELVNYTLESITSPAYGRWDCIGIPSGIAVDSAGNAYTAYNKGLGACGGSGCAGFTCHWPSCAKVIYVMMDDEGVHNQSLTGDLPLPSLYPSVCMDSGDNAHVIWSQHNGSDGYDFYYTQFDKFGNKVIERKRLTYEDYYPGAVLPITDTESGVIHMAWSVPKPKAGENKNILYMAFDACGGTFTNKTLISLEDGDSWEPDIDACFDGAHLVWTDNRDGNNEIYYAKQSLAENATYLSCPSGTWTSMNVNATYTVGILSTMPDTETFNLTLENLDGADIAELNKCTITLDPYTPGEVILNVTDADIGEYRVEIRAESQTNPEINAECVITTRAVVPKPDLIVTAINAYHNNTGCPPWFNLSNEVDVTLGNIGTANASSFYLCLYADAEPIDRQMVSGLERDGSKIVQFKWTPTGADCEDGGSPVEYTLKAIADCDDDINESDETNNELTAESTAYWAGFSADEHLNAVAWHGKLRGGLTYTTGDGGYTGLYTPGSSVDVNYSIALPEGASVKLARLNVYYTWSKADYPVMAVSITNETDTYVVPLDKSYNDRPCDTPPVGYDYPYGNYVYDLTPYIKGSGTYTVTVQNSGPSGCSFCIAAPGIVILYEDETQPERECWLLEGADLLEGGRRGGAGYLALSECICNGTFTGDVDKESVKTATLGIVSAWGGEAWGAYNSYYWSNDCYLGDASILGGYGSLYDKTMDGISMYVGESGNAQVGVNVSDVTDCIADSANTVSFGDDGDSMMAANAFLVVEYSEIEVNKTVWDAERGTWVEKTTAKLNDSLRFKCVIHNVGQYSMTNITAVDILPDCLEYKGNATVDGTPREPDWIAGDQFGWNFTGPLAPCETITIEFDAAVLNHATCTNKLKASAWCPDTNEWHSAEDSVTVIIPEPLSNPFFIYGWVNCSDGSSVNNPDIAITNLNTSNVFIAETIESSNYYQQTLGKFDQNASQVNAGDVLRFAASDSDNPTEFDYTVTQEEIDRGGLFGFNISVEPGPPPTVFDTGRGTYPSIFGIHRGTIKSNQTIEVNKMYTYACAGTGGHSEYVEICNDTFYINATWNGYTGDYHNITFPYQFTLLANHAYNYTVRTGSYPQIHHTDELPTANGWINCTKFTDANGRAYNNWIPAIKLFLD